MNCKQCGQTVSEGARFCAACGAPITAPEAAQDPGGVAAGQGAAPGAWTGSSQAAAPVPADPQGSAPPGPPGPPPVAGPAVGSASTSAYGTSPYAPAPPAYPPAAPVPAATPGHTLRYGGFWRRFWGLIVDRFAVGIVLFPVGLLFGFNMLSEIMQDGEMTPERFMTIMFGSMSMWLVRTFAEWVYFSAFHSSARQATPGQMLLGLRVTGLDGQRIGFGRATSRFFASWISTAILLIGFIMAAFTERKQTLHDMIAGTLVVRDSPGGA